MSEPLVHWRAMQDFGTALREGRLMLQVDAAGGGAQFYPRPVNLLHADADMEWRPASGRGVLMACTVVRSGAGLPRKPPYLFGLVRLEEGPRILAVVEGDVAAPPAIGTALVAQVDAAAQPPLSFLPVQQGQGDHARVSTMTLPLHHRIDGPARAPVLVLAHPLAEDLDFWTPQLAELTPHWRVLRFDARGHGRSPAVDASLDLRTLGEDVLALLDGLGIADAHFCGLSIGGMTGMWLAAHHPRRLKSLVLSNCLPHLGNRDMWQARAEAAAQQPLREIVAQSATRWLSAGFAPARPDDVARLIDAATQMSAQSYAAYCRLLGDADLRAELARIERPVLVIGGSLDVATPPEQCEAMARQIRGARFVRLDGGHFVNWESPRDYARELNQFLAEHPR